MPTFTAEQLRKITEEIFLAAGVPKKESEIVSQHLVEANLAGVDSHGVIRIHQYMKAIQTGKIIPGAKLDVIRETPSSALIDGNRGFGQVIAQQAFELAIQKAKKNAISALSVFGSLTDAKGLRYNCGHTGRLASYTMMAADEGMIGIMMVNAGGGGQTVAPFGGISRRLATNPISIAVPTGKENPIVLDIATSAVPEGKIRAMRNRGEQVPEGFLIDHSGRPTTNPNDFYGPPSGESGCTTAFKGALLPLGGIAGHKGFGLGLIIDILAGGLSTAGCSRADAPQEPSGDGILIIVIDIQKFTSLNDFYNRVEQLVKYVKSSPKAKGFNEILVPGEPEFRERNKRLKSGIFVDETTWRQIKEIIEELSISTE